MTRVVHASDIHITLDPRRFGFADLVGKRLAGWTNLRLLGRYKRFQDAAGVARAFAEDAIAQEGDVIVFSGDVSGVGHPEEFERARVALAPLVERDDVLGIPGNHDVYTTAAVRRRPFTRWFGRWERTDRPDLATAEGGRYPIVRFVGQDLCLLAVQAGRYRPALISSGRIGAAQMEALARALEDPAVRAARVRLLVVHYAPRRHDGRPDTRLHGLDDAEALLACTAAGGVHGILHGHLHRRFVHPRGDVTPVPLLCPGSLVDSKRERAYHVYEIEDGAMQVRVRRFDEGTAAFVEADPPMSLPLGG